MTVFIYQDESKIDKQVLARNSLHEAQILFKFALNLKTHHRFN